MKCSQAAELIDQYLDRRIDESQSKSLKKHIDSCCRCRNELEEKKNIVDLLNSECILKAPADLSENIMQNIFKMADEAEKARKDIPNELLSPFFRRIGLSMLVTAAVMLFSLCIPSGIYSAVNEFTSESTVRITDTTYQITDTIDEVGLKVKSMFNNLNNSIEKLREVKL